MTAFEAEEAIRKWEKEWKSQRDKGRRAIINGINDVDGCNYVDDGQTSYIIHWMH